MITDQFWWLNFAKSARRRRFSVNWERIFSASFMYNWCAKHCTGAQPDCQAPRRAWRGQEGTCVGRGRVCASWGYVDRRLRMYRASTLIFHFPCIKMYGGSFLLAEFRFSRAISYMRMVLHTNFNRCSSWFYVRKIYFRAEFRFFPIVFEVDFLNQFANGGKTAYFGALNFGLWPGFGLERSSFSPIACCPVVRPGLC